jgi:hypothetical protein
MRETRLSGSEGGGAESIGSSYPYQVKWPRKSSSLKTKIPGACLAAGSFQASMCPLGSSPRVDFPILWSCICFVVMFLKFGETEPGSAEEHPGKG